MDHRRKVWSSKHPGRGEPCGQTQDIRGEAETCGVQQEIQLDQGRDLCWGPLGDLKAMGEMSTGHWPEFSTSYPALQMNPEMVRVSRGGNSKRLRKRPTAPCY